MSNLHFLGIIDISQKPTFIAKYSLNEIYADKVIFDIIYDKNLKNSNKKLYIFEYPFFKYLFYFLDVNILFVVVSNVDYNTSYLMKLADEINIQYTQNLNSRKYLKVLGQKYDNISSLNKLANINKKVEETKEIMNENIKIQLDNLDKSADIEIASENLRNASNTFKDNTIKLRRKMCLQNIKMKLILGFIILSIIGIIIGIICAINAKH